LAGDIEVDCRGAHLVEHVFEEAHAGGELRLAAAVEVERTVISVSRVLREISACRMAFSTSLKSDPGHHDNIGFSLWQQAICRPS
jgi:hypothetical protein